MPLNSQSYHLKYLIQLKTKESVWKVIRKSTVNQGNVITQRQVFAFSSDESRILESSLSSGTERKTPLQLEISLIQVNILQKNNFYMVYMVFRASPVFAVL